MDFKALRKEYEDHGIEIDAMDDCPMAQLRQWLAEASEKSPGNWFEANAMALATCDKAGRVAVRYVLLKGVEENGIRFFTNYESAKGKQLESNPHCSVVFHWPYMGRQIRISGTTEKTSREISEAYFHSRPRGAQIGAAASNQSKSLPSRKELEEKMASLEQELEGSPVPLPDQWGGYLIKPEELEFWQGRTNRLHDRIVYTKQAGSWTKCRLAP